MLVKAYTRHAALGRSHNGFFVEAPPVGFLLGKVSCLLTHVALANASVSSRAA